MWSSLIFLEGKRNKFLDVLIYNEKWKKKSNVTNQLVEFEIINSSRTYS